MLLVYEQVGVTLNARLQDFWASEAGLAASEAVPGMPTDPESQIFDRLGDHTRMVVSPCAIVSSLRTCLHAVL